MTASAQPIIFVGGGSLAIEAAAYLCARGEESRLAGIVDPGGGRAADFASLLERPIPVVSQIEQIDIAAHDLLVCFGDPQLRWHKWRELTAQGAKFASIIHPTAEICKTARIGIGTIIGPFAFVAPFAVVNDNAVLNVRATVGHDAFVGHSAVLSPHADINGYGLAGEGAFLGAAAVISPSARLGHFAKLSAGSVLNKVAGDGDLMHGNPASGRKMFRVPVDVPSG